MATRIQNVERNDKKWSANGRLQVRLVLPLQPQLSFELRLHHVLDAVVDQYRRPFVEMVM